MKILVVGGGSGGHITPAVAVVREVLNLKPRAKVEFWTDRKYYANVVKITTEIGWHGVKRISGLGKGSIFGLGKCFRGSFGGTRDGN